MALNPAPVRQPITDGTGNVSTMWVQWFSLLFGFLINPFFKKVTTDSLQFTGGEGDAGTLSYNADEETLDLIQNGAVLQLGQEVHYHVKNQTGSTILNGTPVMAVGTIGNSGRILAAPMDGTDAGNAIYFLGVATEDIANGDDGKVTHFGKVRGIDTSAWSDGDVLWVSATSTGSFVTTEPALDKIGMPVGYVIHSHSNGTIFVRANPLDIHKYTPADVKAPSYTVATLPTGVSAGTIVFVSDESGGAVLAFYDGTNWRRVTDRAVVS